MAAQLNEAAGLARRAAEEEAAARSLDESGSSTQALDRYRRASGLYSDCASRCPDWHRDRATVLRHIEEIETRMAYLHSLQGGAALLPYVSHVAAKQLTFSDGSTGLQTIGTAALLGGLAGLLLSGPRVALLFSGCAAHAATRDDSAGHALRRAGRSSTEVATKAGGRAAVKLRRLQKSRASFCQDALCRLGEVTFGIESTLGAIFARRHHCTSLASLAPEKH
eukprot:TRINITY_DN31006_c0_g1_i1.p1 TRINITY_DN31006_c0_g1~~TRINITY_DN31006_c0_g1_i1.p1  ORF type:complete len:223 (+),score=47.01 TRINITY_DN31006_c0_g1_i1:96-764(+)